MSQSELLIVVLNLLTRLDIPYMVTGSIVFSLQGEPRSTLAIDMVITLAKQAIAPLTSAFPKDQFYINEASVLDAIERKSMFNLIHSTSGNKVDFWLLTDSDYDVARFARRQEAYVLGLDHFYVTSPEDTILSKLRWAKMAGGSEKQLTDAIRVFDMQVERLDINYIRHWIDQISVKHSGNNLSIRQNPINQLIP